jgi:hypothetical protein
VLCLARKPATAKFQEVFTLSARDKYTIDLIILNGPIHSQHLEYPPLLQQSESFINTGWQHKVQNFHNLKGSDGYLQMCSCLDIFILDNFLDTNDELSHHYHMPNFT